MKERFPNKIEQIKIKCKMCDSYFYGYENSKYCSYECSHASSRKFNLTRGQLQELVWQMPTIKLAKILKVSDKAIEKRCKLLGINKPPRGYWAKIKCTPVA